MKTLTLGSLFDGIGGFPLAAQRCGIKAVWASEIETSCIEITKRHFPQVKHLGDITKINGGEIPPVDIISFGSPCQDLSTAGKQIGLSGERSGLFLDAVRIIYEMRKATNGRYPTFIIWENVIGAFSSNQGKDFRVVLEKITNSYIPMPKSGRWATAGMVRGCRGGASVAWRILDSQYWGTPQRRKRIFLVGDFRAGRAPQILFECESVLGYTETCGKERKGLTPAVVKDFEIAGGLAPNRCIADFGRTADRIYYNAEKARTLTATTGGGGSATGNYLDISEIRPINLQVATHCKALGERTGLGIAESGEPAYTLQEQHSHAVFAVYPMRDPQLNQNANGFVVSNKGEPAPTLSATERHAIAVCFAPSSYGTYKEGCGPLRQTGFGDSENLIVILNKIAYWIKYELRKLTPLECERLQGYPDYWTKYGKSGTELPDTPRYRALGNSLTVPCAERVFRGIIAVVKDNAIKHSEVLNNGKKEQ
ncbi:MAG: DNA cytosine methyltransferase [Ruminococcus sp.]|nr:DNA cytosine methyltransferase [Ruminococcus sp.]